MQKVDTPDVVLVDTGALADQLLEPVSVHTCPASDGDEETGHLTRVDAGAIGAHGRLRVLEGILSVRRGGRMGHCERRRLPHRARLSTGQLLDQSGRDGRQVVVHLQA